MGNYAFNWMANTPRTGDTTLRIKATALAALCSLVSLSVPAGGPAGIVDIISDN